MRILIGMSKIPQIYERSDGTNELGAAIHLCSNASRVLLSWGLDPVTAKFVEAKKTYIAKGTTLERVYEADYSSIASTYGAPWYFSHRIDLHNALKHLATASDGVGKPAIIFPHSKVVNYVRLSVTLRNLLISLGRTGRLCHTCRLENRNRRRRCGSRWGTFSRNEACARRITGATCYGSVGFSFLDSK
jgi:hypothetical protein